MGRRHKRPSLHGWLILDKPQGMTSNQALGRAKRLFGCKKAGHAGTLDPLATGCLPIAFGEATKTVPYVVDERKAYRFTVKWGEATNTDDSDGEVIASSDHIPTDDEIDAVLDAFVGDVEQVPPQFSAIKVDGERAYDRARDGEHVELKSRIVEIESLELIESADGQSVFECHCGKGTYVRAIARDMGKMLGSYGHVTALRRLMVHPFTESDLVSMDDLEAAVDPEESAPDAIKTYLRPVEAGLGTLPRVDIHRGDVERLRRGQSVLMRGRDAPIIEGFVCVMADDALVALAEADGATLHPRRVFDLSTGP